MKTSVLQAFAKRWRRGALNRGLLLGALAIGVAMVGLLGFELLQRRALQAQANVRVDSVTAPAFLLDREFLRLHAELDAFLHARRTPDVQALQLRADIVHSKVAVLKNSPGSSLLLTQDENVRALAQIESFAQHTDAALAHAPPDRAQLQAVLDEMQRFSAESLALGNAADLLGARLLEQQNRELLAQNQQIIWLTLAQLALISATAAALLWRQLRQEREALALQRLNQELLLARQEADEANRGKSVFLANMSHELRTPFNGMMGLLSLLAETPLSERQAQLVQTTNQSAAHLLRLLNDILDMSALEAGKITLHPEPTHMQKLLLDVEAVMRPLAEQKGLAFVLHHPLHEPVWLQTDGTRLRQIVFNLLNNAIKFTEQGQVSLIADIESSEPGASPHGGHSEQLVLAVRDTGIGLDQDALSRVFERFFQVDAGRARKYEGLGLGLEISLTLARRMGGDIRVQSLPGQGSTFTVRLPVQRCAPALAQPAAQHLGAVQSAAPGQGLRILVAEDHPTNRMFMAALLKKLGHQAVFCENGLIALQTLQQQAFDLILMDIHMPVMDGLSATQAIRALPTQEAGIPIVALTADVLPEAREQAQAAGIDAFVCKPVHAQELQQVIERLRPAA